MANNEVDDVEPLTDLTSTQNNLNRWAPRFFKVHQQLDLLEFVAVSRSVGAPLLPVLRMLSNRDVHVYGEFVMHDGAIRSFNTVGITCLSAGHDVLSIRTGSGGATEVARFTRDAALKLTARPEQTDTPTIQLDARNSGGVQWTMASDSSGSLVFSSGVGNPSATLDSAGSLALSDGFFRMRCVTLHPDLSALSGTLGDMFLWNPDSGVVFKVAVCYETGTGNWYTADLS